MKYLNSLFQSNKRHALIVSCLLTMGLSACDTSASATSPTPNNTPAQTVHLQAPSQNDSAVVAALQQNLNKSDIELTVISAIATPVNGIYWATFDNSPPMFTDAKGEYLIQGQIAKIGVEQPFDIIDELQANLAKEQLSKVDPSQMIIFPAKGKRIGAVYVFSDPTCHYCQKLHKEIEQINAKGVEVRYLAWPRSEKLISLAEAVWCSSNKQDAITQAKLGKKITAPACDNPVRQHMTLGHQIGVSGTPAIFTESGVQIGGYLPADELAQQVREYSNP